MNHRETRARSRCFPIGMALLLFTGGCESIAGLDDLRIGKDATAWDAAVTVPEDGATVGAGDAAGTAPPRDAGSSPRDSAASATDAGSDATQTGNSIGAADATAGSADGSVLDARTPDTASLDASGISDASAADATQSTPDASTMPIDLGRGDGSDVVLMGDSWMSNTLQTAGTGGGIAPALLSASKQPYRSYAVQGVALLGSGAFGAAIPAQWDAAKRGDPDIKTVAMTGGANDILLNAQASSDCVQGGSICAAKLQEVRSALGKLWAQMATDGVRDIVYIVYSKAANSRIKDIDAHVEALDVVCRGVTAPARCHLFRSDNYVKASDLVADGVHPSAAANASIAAGLVDLMARQGMRR